MMPMDPPNSGPRVRDIITGFKLKNMPNSFIGYSVYIDQKKELYNKKFKLPIELYVW